VVTLSLQHHFLATLFQPLQVCPAGKSARLTCAAWLVYVNESRWRQTHWSLIICQLEEAGPPERKKQREEKPKEEPQKGWPVSDLLLAFGREALSWSY